MTVSSKAMTLAVAILFALASVAYAQGGSNFVASSMSSAGYQDQAEWNARPQVGDDLFEAAILGDTYSLSIGGRTVGSTLPMGTRIAA